MSQEKEHAFAVVESIEAEGLRLKFDGEDAAGEKTYKCNTFFVFAPGDRVYCVRDSGTYVAICKIGKPITEITVQKATEAEKAKNAEQSEKSDVSSEITDKNNEEYYTIQFRWNGTKQYIEYNHPLMGSGWLPMLSPLDESVASYSAANVVKLRSTSAGKLEYCVPLRSATTWHTITST